MENKFKLKLKKVKLKEISDVQVLSDEITPKIGGGVGNIVANGPGTFSDHLMCRPTLSLCDTMQET